MLRLTSVLFILCSLPLSAQDSNAAKKFIGEWQAKFRDKVICTIRLQSGDPISGQSENCRINVDANGDLQEPDSDGQPDSASPILNPKLNGPRLSFEEKEGDDVIKFEFTLVGDGKAELRILDAPVGVKPIPFVRQHA
jgi:hypothetical protein